MATGKPIKVVVGDEFAEDIRKNKEQDEEEVEDVFEKKKEAVEEDASDTEASDSEDSDSEDSDTGSSDTENSDTIEFKRFASQEPDDDEEIMRSMARRKKNPSAEELAPKKCREPGCTKEFKRPCDLTKHEKTHSRPWKCPVPTCKYHEYGWPTEKEMDRHHNDKHSSTPPMYECLYKPCPYKSKRESNCKQHMEKAHGWTYVRTKSNGKKTGMLSSDTMSNTAYHTPQPHGLPTPSSDYSMGVATPPEDFNAYYSSNMDFPTYLPSATDFNISQELTIDYSPRDVGDDLTLPEDMYAHHLPNMYSKEMPQPQFPRYTPAGLASQPMAHLSPAGPGTAPLYTPTSVADAEEGVEDSQDFAAMGTNQSGDFVLFPDGGVPKPVPVHPLFVGELAGMGTGLPQHASQDVIAQAIQQHMEWSSYDFSHYPSSQR